MKVILSAKSVYPFHPVGGVQKYVYYFAKHLVKKGVDVEIVAPLDRGKPRTEMFDNLTYTFLSPSIYWYLEYPIGWLGVHLFSQALAKYLQDKSFDLLHSFDMTGYQYFKQGASRPGIAHIFTDNYLCNPLSSKNLFKFLNIAGVGHNEIKKDKVKISPFSDDALKRQYWAQYQFKIKPIDECLRRADKIFFEDDMVRRDVNELFHLDEKKGAVLPVGVDVDFFEKKVKSSNIHRGDFAFTDKDMVLLTVNRLAADKGVDKIILALEKIVKEYPKTYLIIVGSGYQQAELKELIHEKGLTTQVLHYENVPEEKLFMYFKVSDIYISAFSYLGSSISSLEAMACSLPIITTGQPWLVKEGKNGMVLPSNDPDLIYQAVMKMWQAQGLKEKGKISRERVVDYDWNTIADKAIETYQELLKNPKSEIQIKSEIKKS